MINKHSHSRSLLSNALGVWSRSKREIFIYGFFVLLICDDDFILTPRRLVKRSEDLTKGQVLSHPHTHAAALFNEQTFISDC